MTYLIISIIGILVTIIFVIGTHELAHFLAARAFGVKVLRFSIGFGKTLFRKFDKSGTEYVFALIPLGGYVKMLDETEGEVPKDELHLAYNRQPFYKKFLIVLAGPMMNILCALVLYAIIYMHGFQTLKPIIGDITPGSIAAIAGLHPKQEIMEVEGTETSAWTGIIFRLITHLGNNDVISMKVKNPNGNSEVHQLNLTGWQINPLTPDPLNSLGITPYFPYIPLIIGKISPDSPASSSNLKISDHLIAIDGQKIGTWDQFIQYVLNNPEKNSTITVLRNDKTINIPVQIGYKRNLLFQKEGFLGIGPDFKLPDDLLKKIQYGPIDAFSHAYQQIVDFAYFNLILFGKIFLGKLSLESLGGPITIFQSAGDALNYSFMSFIAFLAFLSISIGIINLLPVPGLDGAHLVFLTVEFIIRRPIPTKVLYFFYYCGFLLILFVLIQSMVNDILRLT